VVGKSAALNADATSKDWLWRGTFQTAMYLQAGDAADVNFKVQADVQHLDIKVKRKLRQEEGIFFTFEPFEDILSGADPATFGFLELNMRYLVMLP